MRPDGATGAEPAAAAGAQPATLADRRRRLAIFSPVPPIPSGISTYLLDVLPLLPSDWDIELFTDDDLDPDLETLAAARAGAGCFSHAEFEARHAAEPYDLNVYQVGNSTERTWMLSYVSDFPGLLVLHDGVLHPARLESAIATGNLASYRRTARVCRDDDGAAIGHLVAGGLGGPALFRTVPMCEDLVRASLVTAMHGDLLCGWLRGLVPEADIVPLVHWRSVGSGDDVRQDEWRARLGGPDVILGGSFGNIGSERRLDRVFEALAGLETTRPWRFVIAGRVDPRLGLEELARTLGIDKRVAWHGELADADFMAVMGAVDFAVNLRYPPARASSGVLHQLLQLGVPAMISDVVHWREYPEPAVVRVPPGPDVAEQQTLRDALATWIDDDAARRDAAASAKRWAAAHLTARGMRESYVAAVDRALKPSTG